MDGIDLVSRQDGLDLLVDRGVITGLGIPARIQGADFLPERKKLCSLLFGDGKTCPFQLENSWRKPVFN